MHGFHSSPVKIRTRIILGVVLVLVGLVAWPVWSWYAWTRDYGEAEPLEPVVWAMAGEMRLFDREHGRSPASLEEISRYSTEHDFSRLRGYSHEFTPTGSRRFSLRVNGRFAFDIDGDLVPNWSNFTPVMGTPTQSR